MVTQQTVKLTDAWYFSNTVHLTDIELENVSGGISDKEALAAAIRHAGIPSDAARLTKLGRDYEHGNKVYEIEYGVSDET